MALINKIQALFEEPDAVPVAKPPWFVLGRGRRGRALERETHLCIYRSRRSTQTRKVCRDADHRIFLDSNEWRSNLILTVMTESSLEIQSIPTSSSPSSPNGISDSFATNECSLPSTEEIEDLLLDCRYGDIDAVRVFVERHGANALANAKDERGNNALHMCAANGHDDILTYILSLPSLPASLLTSNNDSGNTPLHWACVNAQLECVKRLVGFAIPPSSSAASSGSPTPGNLSGDIRGKPGVGPALILARNNAGHTPLGEAELNGWEEGARWLVGVMDLQLAADSAQEGEREAGEEATGKVSEGEKRTDGEELPVERDLERLRLGE